MSYLGYLFIGQYECFDTAFDLVVRFGDLTEALEKIEKVKGTKREQEAREWIAFLLDDIESLFAEVERTCRVSLAQFKPELEDLYWRFAHRDYVGMDIVLDNLAWRMSAFFVRQDIL